MPLMIPMLLLSIKLRHRGMGLYAVPLFSFDHQFINYPAELLSPSGMTAWKHGFIRTPATATRLGDVEAVRPAEGRDGGWEYEGKKKTLGRWMSPWETKSFFPSHP